MMRRLLLFAWLSLVAGPAAAETLLVANKSGDTLSFLELSSGEVVQTVPTGTGPHEVAVSPDGRRAVVTNYGRETAGNTLTLVDVVAGKVTGTIDLGDHTRPHGIEFLPDGQRVVVTAEGSRNILIVDMENGRIETAVPVHQELSHMVALSEDAGRAYVANIGSGSVSAITLEGTDPRHLESIPTGDGAEGVTVAGGRVWVTNRGENTVSVVDPGALEVVKTLEAGDFPIRAEATPDGSRVLVTNARSAELDVYDAREMTRLHRVDIDIEPGDTAGRAPDASEGSSVPIGIQPGPNGKRAWIAHANADTIMEIDLESFEVRRLLSAGKEPDGMAYTPLSVDD